MNRDFFPNDDSSRSTDDSSLPPPPPPPRTDQTHAAGDANSGWTYFESRFESWVSTVEGSTVSSAGSESFRDNSVESFHDNSSDVESPVIITNIGSGWEVQHKCGGTHSPRTADRMRKMILQQTQQRSNKAHRHKKEKKSLPEGNISHVSHMAENIRKWFTPKTCLVLAIVTVLILCGVLGVILVTNSRARDGGSGGVNDVASFGGDMTIGNSGPPMDEYNGPNTGFDFGADLIDEVGEEGYYNDEDDDGVIADEDYYSSSSMDSEVNEEGLDKDEVDLEISQEEIQTATIEPTVTLTRRPTDWPTRQPTKAPSVSEPEAPRPTVSVAPPMPAHTRQPPTAPRPQSRPIKQVKKLSPHNQYTVPKQYTTDFDGHILVPERKRNTLYIFDGGKSPADRSWDESNALWSLRLYPRPLWVRSNSINDVKRVIHRGKIHIAVCGSGGDAVALYDFQTKAAVYWSHTCGSAPHDVEYLPLRGGYMAVASARGKDSTIELYDVSSSNDQECIRGSTIDHNGVHSLHWDAKQKRLWAWGSDTVGLIAYRVIFGSNGYPRLVKDEEYQPDVQNFKVATGHGGSPMIVNGRRYLLLAGDSGILRFDTESHEWFIERRAPNNEGVYSNPKGISYNMESGEIIMAKSNSRVYSTETGQRQILIADIYKARWWQHNAFSYNPDETGGTASISVPKPAPKPAPKPDSFFDTNDLVGVYYFPRGGGQQYLRNQLQPPQPPKLGAYNDADPRVIAQHLAWSREANINLWVTGWRGPNSKEDTTIRNVIMKHKELPGTKIALLYETNNRISLNGESGLDNIYSDVEFISQTYFDNPNYLRIDGRPVLYLYLSRVLHHNLILEQVVTLMRQAAADNGGFEVYMIGDQAFGNAPQPGRFYYPFDLLDAVTSYDVYGDIGRGGYAGQEGVMDYYNKQKKWHDAALAHESCAFIPSVTPGFNDGRHSPLSRKVDVAAAFGSLFRRLLDNALNLADSSGSRMVMITSWNGFHDDTQIEPVQEAPATEQAAGPYNQMQLNYQGYGKLYLNIARQTTARKRRQRQ